MDTNDSAPLQEVLADSPRKLRTSDSRQAEQSGSNQLAQLSKAASTVASQPNPPETRQQAELHKQLPALPGGWLFVAALLVLVLLGSRIEALRLKATGMFIGNAFPQSPEYIRLQADTSNFWEVTAPASMPYPGLALAGQTDWLLAQRMKSLYGPNDNRTNYALLRLARVLALTNNQQKAVQLMHSVLPKMLNPGSRGNTDTPTDTAFALVRLGDALSQTQPAEALLPLEKAYEYWDFAPPPRTKSNVWADMSALSERAGDNDRALGYMKRALDYSMKHWPDGWFNGWRMREISRLSSNSRKYEEAAEAARSSLNFYASINYTDQEELGFSNYELARAQLGLKQYDMALQSFAVAKEHFREANNYYVNYCDFGSALAYQELGNSKATAAIIASLHKVDDDWLKQCLVEYEKTHKLSRNNI